MKRLISAFTWLAVSLCCAQSLWAQQEGRTQGPQKVSRQMVERMLADTVPTFGGVQITADVAGAIQRMVSDYGQYEAAVRVNLKERFFPTVELGLGQADKTDDGTDIHYKTTAPYVRVGADYNFLRDLKGGNRIYAGLRLAATSYKYDVTSPPLTDPVWHESVPFVYKDQKGSMVWGELVGGIEAKIWGCFHLGWTARIRMRASQKKGAVGEAWYVPGFGRNGSTRLAATFNVIFDI